MWHLLLWNRTYSKIEELREDYRSGTLHPDDVKLALTKSNKRYIAGLNPFPAVTINWPIRYPQSAVVLYIYRIGRTCLTKNPFTDLNLWKTLIVLGLCMDRSDPPVWPVGLKETVRLQTGGWYAPLLEPGHNIRMSERLSGGQSAYKNQTVLMFGHSNTISTVRCWNQVRMSKPLTSGPSTGVYRTCWNLVHLWPIQENSKATCGWFV